MQIRFRRQRGARAARVQGCQVGDEGSKGPLRCQEQHPKSGRTRWEMELR